MSSGPFGAQGFRLCPARPQSSKAQHIVSFGQIKAINKFVDETGGEVLGAGKTEVDQRLGLIIDRLRARYAIGFRPSKAADQSFRPVEIKISSARSRNEKLLVLTKRGYYSRPRN